MDGRHAAPSLQQQVLQPGGVGAEGAPRPRTPPPPAAPLPPRVTATTVATTHTHTHTHHHHTPGARKPRRAARWGSRETTERGPAGAGRGGGLGVWRRSPPTVPAGAAARPRPPSLSCRSPSEDDARITRRALSSPPPSASDTSSRNVGGGRQREGRGGGGPRTASRGGGVRGSGAAEPPWPGDPGPSGSPSGTRVRFGERLGARAHEGSAGGREGAWSSRRGGRRAPCRTTRSRGPAPRRPALKTF